MKKIVVVIISVLLVIIVGVLIISRVHLDTEVTREQTKVGMLLNGTIDDRSWSQSHYEGMQKTAKECNLAVTYKESVPETEVCKSVMEELIAHGCQIIICNSFGYGDYEAEVAKEHPEVYFFHATGVSELDNMATYFGRMYQMRYLSGIVAGMQTKTNAIGYVAAYDIAEVNRGINAFTLGVRSVNPDAQVYVVFSESWEDEESNRTACERLFENHADIDVLGMHCDALSPLEVAQERGCYAIGYNMDNSDLFPDIFLTAPVWRWDKFYNSRILECLQGKFVGKHYWEGVETGLVELAPLNDCVDADVSEAVEQEKERLNSGSFDVFYGPITDNQGVVRVKEGESMTDETMLTAFDWYVEGVVIDEE